MLTKKRIIGDYLVARARLGDSRAREQLVLRYQKKYLAHAYRLLGNAEQTRDAVQEGWVDILRGLPKLRDDSAFSAWSFRIITRKCAGEINKVQKNRGALKTMSKESLLGKTGENEFDKVNDRQLVHTALAELSREHRAAVTLFYLKDMSVAEIAVTLEIPVGTVKTRLMNARKKLRAALEGEKNG